MNLHFDDIAKITRGEVLQRSENCSVTEIHYDSRQIIPGFAGSTNLFLAIKGTNNDGHMYLHQAYQLGFRQFIIEYLPDTIELPDANVLIVPNSIRALQKIAEFHRNKFNLPVIGITGSNGKTVVKEWLSTFLSSRYHLVKNRGSFNSQLGVPLSILNIRDSHSIGIFEAGISFRGEMETLEKIIKPGIGLFTNIGSAHDAGFKDRAEKIKEKLQLFKNSTVLIYREDDEQLDKIIRKELATGPELLSWSTSRNSKIKSYQKSERLIVDFPDHLYSFERNPSNPASFENLVHCIVLLEYLGFPEDEINSGIEFLSPVEMRLELISGVNGCDLIDDTYNNDLDGIEAALDFITKQRHDAKAVFIISDILQSRLTGEELYKNLSELIHKYPVEYIAGIGPVIGRFKNLFPKESVFYPSTEAFIENLGKHHFQDQVLLIKGARPFHMEKIVRSLTEKIHDTTLEISLPAVIHNLNAYRSRLNAETKIMVMVKALAYGSGDFEIARLLQFHRIDYLGVAYVDEGVALRKNGIVLPILVMNSSMNSFDKINENNLEPEIFSISNLKKLDEYTRKNKKSIRVHLKIDTGMHRLGFNIEDANEIIQLLRLHPYIEVSGIFSHLASADDTSHNPFTRDQIERFDDFAGNICNELNINPIRHILNSAGILSFPSHQLDMVRLGIGLYGYDPLGKIDNELEPVSSLKTTISQIKMIPKGESVGYGRKGVANKNTTIATIAIGYADGYNRRFGNGVGKVWINGQKVSTIGNICMDMAMLDISGIEAIEGDTVEIFGPNQSLYELAQQIGTIPYEILTSVSDRVKRVYKHN